MENNYHILNGDALKQQFPEKIKGEIIVARECLVDGGVKSNALDEFFEMRSRYITEVYGDFTVEDYYRNTVSEFERIKGIPPGSSIHLWFEDDLFCQVNFWFVGNLIVSFAQESDVFLIRPPFHTPYGFGGLDESTLVEAYQRKIRITELEKIGRLWKSYQDGDREKLIETAKELEASFPFILRAVEAHLARIPAGNNPGRPEQALREIINELETPDFASVFKEFNKREAIYGFGDLQVKRLYDKIRNNR